jgi:hypothetical protein
MRRRGALKSAVDEHITPPPRIVMKVRIKKARTLKAYKMKTDVLDQRGAKKKNASGENYNANHGNFCKSFCIYLMISLAIKPNAHIGSRCDKVFKEN